MIQCLNERDEKRKKEANNPSGLCKNDTLEDALSRADELSNPNGGSYSGTMLDRKDLRRIVLLAKEYRNLLDKKSDPSMDKWIEEMGEVSSKKCSLKKV